MGSPYERRTTGARLRALTGRQRLLLGGIGGLAPVMLNLALLDADAVFSHATLAACLGYTARVSALFTVGALIAWLHETETVRLRLFELGVAWPAFIMASLNGAAASEHLRTGVQSATAARIAVLEWALPTAAYAALAQPRIFSFDAPPESALQGFVRGLTGANAGGRSFVLLRENFAIAAQAVSRASELRATLSVETRVYDGKSGPSRTGFEVVLGDWMSAEAAVKLEGDLARRGVAVRTWAR